MREFSDGRRSHASYQGTSLQGAEKVLDGAASFPKAGSVCNRLRYDLKVVPFKNIGFSREKLHFLKGTAFRPSITADKPVRLQPLRGRLHLQTTFPAACEALIFVGLFTARLKVVPWIQSQNTASKGASLIEISTAGPQSGKPSST
jgi:hypothetical protein